MTNDNPGNSIYPAAIIYRYPYPNTGKSYIGSSVSDNPNYKGSPSNRAMVRIEADHDRTGKPVVQGVTNRPRCAQSR